MKIFKYPLFTGGQIVELPIGAKMLDVQLQNGCPVLWALVDEDAPTEPITVYWYATGESVHAIGEYLATVQLASNLVIHVFTKHEARSVRWMT